MIFICYDVSQFWLRSFCFSSAYPTNPHDFALTPKNTALRIINNSERVQNIYTDRECTQLYDDSERGAEDLTLYVPTEARPSE